MDRRRSLRVAGVASASALASCVLAPSSASPSPTEIRTPVPSPTAAPTARAPDWNALARALKGELVRPSDPAYDAARVIYNTRFDGIGPQGVARCASADDVRACVAFAAQTGVPLALRSGGHGYGGWSTGPGLVVDTGPMSGIDLGQQGRVTVGAGAKLIDVYATLARAGQGIPAGSCATVGITGLTLGGGVGVMSRAWGLTCDDLVSAEVVTADGRALVCHVRRARGESDANEPLHGRDAARRRVRRPHRVAVPSPWPNLGRPARARDLRREVDRRGRSAPGRCDRCARDGSSERS